MTLADAAHHCPLSPQQAYLERHALWLELHRQQGPGRSYPYAWRLPELARPLGSASLRQAQRALALDLYTLGRFGEAQAALAGEDEHDQSMALHLRLLLGQQTDMDGAAADGQAQAELAYLLDRPDLWPTRMPTGTHAEDRHWHIVLQGWRAARLRQPVDLAASHRALAGLRRLHPALAAQAEAVFAETAYCLSPRWAPVWLDLALDQVERFSQHHLKTRLLGLKARALEGAGELGEGARFRKLAQDLARRQGAELYRRRFIDPA